MKFSFTLCYDDSNSCITDDVGDNTRHVQNSVDACEKCDGLKGQIDCIENDCQHDQTGPGNTGCSNGSENSCDHDHNLLCYSEVNAEYL